MRRRAAPDTRGRATLDRRRGRGGLQHHERRCVATVDDAARQSGRGDLGSDDVGDHGRVPALIDPSKGREARVCAFGARLLRRTCHKRGASPRPPGPSSRSRLAWTAFRRGTRGWQRQRSCPPPRPCSPRPTAALRGSAWSSGAVARKNQPLRRRAPVEQLREIVSRCAAPVQVTGADRDGPFGR